MQIPLFKPFVNPDALAGLRKIFTSGWIGLGPKTEEFEQAFCEYTGAKYAVAMNSCTAALHLSLICAGIEDCDLVYTTPMTFVSTNEAIKYTGAAPEFVDILPDTMSMDPMKLRRHIEENGPPKALIVVHYGGMPADIDAFLNLSRVYDFPIIWDCAHAMGASYKDLRLGCFEKYACFSFHAVKNLGIGDGGMVATNDKEVYERLKRLRWMGVDSSTYERSTGGGYKWLYSVGEIGWKYHMNDVSAVIALTQLKDLEWQNEKRRFLADQYQKFLADQWVANGDIQIVNMPKEDQLSAQHLFVIRVRKGSRDGLHDYLAEKGITTGVHYYPNNLYDMFDDTAVDCPEASKAFNQALSLPMYWQMTTQEQDYVCQAIKSYFDSL